RQVPVPTEAKQGRQSGFSWHDFFPAGPAAELGRYPSPNLGGQHRPHCTMAKKSTSKKTTKHRAESARSAPAPAKVTTMTLEQALEQLESLGNERMRAHNIKYGAGDNQFGVKHGDIRVLAKKIKTNQELATALWETGNVDAQLLATLVIKPKSLSAEEVDRMVRSVACGHVP